MTRSSNHRWALLPWVACLVAVAPLLYGGFPDGNDWTFELVRVSEYRSALADGQLPPAWAPNLYGGFGSPIFLFYAPAFSLTASLLSWVAGSIPAGATAALVLFAALGVVAMRSLGRAVVGRDESRPVRVGVYLYLLHPYLLCDLLHRNASAEFAALCVMPLALAGLASSAGGGGRAARLLAGGLAAVILTHNLTAVIITVLLLAGAVTIHPPWRHGRRWPALAGGLALGLAMSAFFWVPVVALRAELRTEELIGGKLDFHRHFASPWEIFGYGRAFSAGLLPLVVLVGGGAALYLALRDRDPRARWLGFALAAAAVFVFLVTPFSAPLWEAIPPLALFQFPWRMLGPAALLTAVVGALAFSRLSSRWSPRTRAAAEVALLVACVLNAVPQLAQYRPLQPHVRAALDGGLAPETIRREGYKATVGDEYLPRSADREAWRRHRPRIDPLLGSRPPLIDATVESSEGTRSLVRVEAAAPSRLELARWAFPAWSVRVDGRRHEALASEFGSLAVDLPAGNRTVELEYRPPRSRRISLWISVLGLLAWICLGRLRSAPEDGGGHAASRR